MAIILPMKENKRPDDYPDIVKDGEGNQPYYAWERDTSGFSCNWRGFNA